MSDVSFPESVNTLLSIEKWNNATATSQGYYLNTIKDKVTLILREIWDLLPQWYEDIKVKPSTWIKDFLEDLSASGIGRMTQIDKQVLEVLKVAYLIELQAWTQYADYIETALEESWELDNVKKALKSWTDEEVQHGLILKAVFEAWWMDWDADAAFESYIVQNPKPNFERYGTEWETYQQWTLLKELYARTDTEIGTKNFYSALRTKVKNPKIISLLELLSRDEIRHFRMFIALRKIVANEESSLQEAYTWLINIYLYFKMTWAIVLSTFFIDTVLKITAHMEQKNLDLQIARKVSWWNNPFWE